MNTLPHPLVLDIVRRLSHHGFRELGPLIAASPETNSYALDATVLKEVDIDEFIFVTRLANEDSIYRPFLIRCLDAMNPTAQYVEGLRMAAYTGTPEVGFELVATAARQLIYARFATMLLLFLTGHYDAGIRVMDSFFYIIPTIEEAVGIAQTMITQVRDMGYARVGRFDNGFRFLGIPHCFLNGFSVLHLCRKCFVFMYATRFQDLC